MSYETRSEDRFTIGLWCTAQAGREAFGRGTRPEIDSLETIRRLPGVR